MRSILIFLFLIISSLASAATYYVATNGSDGNSGSISSPFATWQKGFSVAQPGDIVYIRGGTYYPEGIFASDVYSGVYINQKNGSEGKMINVWAYPGEMPVLDCKNMTQVESHMGIYLRECSYWYLKGLTIKNCIQTPGGFGAHGLYLRSGNYNRFEQIDISYIGGSGLCIVYNAEGNYIYNCDVHECFDQYTKHADGTPNAGDDADGIDCADITERSGNERVNTFRGVRSWNNSDDGFDHYRNDGILVIDSCWVWHNGFNYGGTTPTGNGNGFKLGKTLGTPESVAQRTVTNCIAFDNRQRGYSQEDANVNMIFYNNIAYKNELQGYSFVTYNRPDIVRNNIAYKNSADGVFQSQQTNDHNSWNSGVTVSDADFQSLDAGQLMRPRKANGSLPDIEFLALAPGSDLIDKGVNVSHSYSGTAPDLGPFETGATATTPPVYVSSVIQGSAPSSLEMTYNLPLASVIPSASSFIVMVNSVARPVNSVAISGAKVILTLASPVSAGNTVTVSYTKPATNPLQNPSSGTVESISAKSVSLVSFSTGGDMLYMSSVIEDPTPANLTITYNLNLSTTILPEASRFDVSVNSVARTVSSYSISGTNVTLNLSNPVAKGDIVTVGYTKPTTNLLQSTGGSEAPNMSAKPVTNNVGNNTDVSAPAYLSAVIDDPRIIELTYNLELAPVIPPVTSFSVLVDNQTVKVEEVKISGPVVLITLATPVSADDKVILDYNVPASNPLQTIDSGTAPGLDNVAVSVIAKSVIPEYISSEVRNESPEIIELIYNIDLANDAPESSAFTAKINGDKRTVKKVTINGTKVMLTLLTTIAMGDNVTISYNKPETNPLHTISGGKAYNFSDLPVTNSISKGKISIFPNPATNFINIANIEPTAGSRILRIFDFSGKLCLEKLLNSDSENRIPINLKSGMYVVQIVFGPIIKYAQKLIVK